MQVRTGVRAAVAAAAATGLVAVGATAVAATTGSTGPTGLCLAEGTAVTAARSDGNGGFTCPSGRTPVVLAADGALQDLRRTVGDLFAEVDTVRTHGVETSHRVGTVETDLLGLQDRAASTDGALAALQSDLGQTQDALTATRAELTRTRDALTELQRRTTTSTVSVPLAFAGGPVTRTVSCDGGSALSGSARTSGAQVLQSAVTDGGGGWAFVVEPTAETPSATLLVVCAGRTVAPGGVSPGSPTGPGTSSPTGPGTSSPTGPGTSSSTSP